jgi:hypothetical protein
VKRQTIQAFLFIVLGVFIYNQVADQVFDHHSNKSELTCEVNQVEEPVELESKTKYPDSRVSPHANFLFAHLHDLLSTKERSALVANHWCASFPHALHVPIYLDKCTFII